MNYWNLFERVCTICLCPGITTLVNVTFSVSVTDRIAVSLSTMMSNADIELYRAKEFDRDRTQVAA